MIFLKYISGWTTSVGYLNAVNNVVLRASIEDAKNSDDFDDMEEWNKNQGSIN